MNLKIWLAEFVGSFALLFVGVAAISLDLGNLGVSLAFGMIITIMISIFGSISYAHFNPAVSLGFLILRFINLKEMLLYWSAELAGALFGLLTLRCFLGQDALALVNYGATQVSSKISSLQAFGIEVVVSFLLLLVISASVLQKQKLAAIYIGSTVALASITFGGLTGASMNPARSFAPALFSGLWLNHWIYWAAPMMGATFAAFFAKYMFTSIGKKMLR